MAQLKLVYENFEKTEALDNFVKSHVQSVVEKFIPQRNASLAVVKLTVEKSKKDAGKETYGCEIQVKDSRWKFLSLKTQRGDMYAAVNLACDRLNNMMSRLHRKLVNKRRSAGRRESCQQKLLALE